MLPSDIKTNNPDKLRHSAPLKPPKITMRKNVKPEEKQNIKKRKRNGEKKLYKSKKKMNGYPFPLIQEKKVVEEMKALQASMRKHIYQCTVCYEAWPLNSKPKEKM